MTAHVLHVSSAAAVEALAESGLSGETCPHYLTFDAAEIPDGATAFKCAPPIRGAGDRERLWEALREGVLTMVVSDHSPAPPEVKESSTGDFLAAWGGSPRSSCGWPPPGTAPVGVASVSSTWPGGWHRLPPTWRGWATAKAGSRRATTPTSSSSTPMASPRSTSHGSGNATRSLHIMG